MTLVESELGRATDREPSHGLGPLQQWLYLSVLAGALGYAAFQHGGRNTVDCSICLAMVGAGSLSYWATTPSARLAPAIDKLTGYLAFLIPTYIALQLVPLPLFLLRMVSPERGRIADSLRAAMPAAGFAPLTISQETTLAYLLRTIGYVLVFLLVREVAARSRQGWAAAVPLMGIAGLEAAVGLWQKADGAAVLSGTYWSQDHFAGLLEMVLPMTVAGAIYLLKGRDGLGTGIATGRALAAGAVLVLASVMLADLVWCGSKSGFLAGFAGLFAMSVAGCAASIRGWKRWGAMAGLGVGFALVLVALPPDELAQALTHAATDRTAEGRVPIWSDGRHLLAAYPVTGSGMGTFDTAFLRYQTAELDEDFTFAHNDYLQLATELGAVGFLLLAGFGLAMAAKSWRAGTLRCDADTRYLAWGCTGGMAAIGLHSFTDFNLYFPANAMVLAWIFGIVSSFPGRSGRAARARRWRPAAMVVSGLLVVYAGAWILLETRFRRDARVEARFCAFGVCDTNGVVASETDQRGGDVAAVPQGVLRTALRRDPDNAFRWCDLGEALARSGRVEQARGCFARALALGPNIPPLEMRAANFYFAIHDGDRAMGQTVRVLENSALYDRVIFETYRREQIPLSKIVATGLPQSERAWQAYLRYAMERGKYDDAAAVWDAIVRQHYGDGGLAREYLGFLFQDHRYEAAAHAWAGYAGDRGRGYLESNYVYNGDFEAERSGVEFDWTMGDVKDDVKVTIDASVAHTGSHALRMEFAGKENVDYSGTWERAVVRPGRYRFSAFVRAEGITTDQGVGFRIFDAESSARVDVRTEQVKGTTDWKELEQSFSVPAGTRLLTIQVARPASWRFDSHIAGTVWIDGVSLSRVE